MKKKHRYPSDWPAISLQVKIAAKWQCQRCGCECLKPEDEARRRSLSRSQWTALTLSTHHWDCLPENNHPDNLAALCTGCHLSIHGGSGTPSVSPGQLAFFKDDDPLISSASSKSLNRLLDKRFNLISRENKFVSADQDSAWVQPLLFE